MICCWCGREIQSEEHSFWSFRSKQRVHFWCFLDYTEDQQTDRRELVERLELGGEA